MSVIAKIETLTDVPGADDEQLARAIVLAKANLAWLRSDAESQNSKTFELKSARDKLHHAFPVAFRKIAGHCSFFTEQEIQVLNSFTFSSSESVLKII